MSLYWARWDFPLFTVFAVLRFIVRKIVPQQTPDSLLHQISVEVYSARQWNGNTFTTFILLW